MIQELKDLFTASPVANKFTNLGGVVSALLEITFMMAFFLSFIWLVWGAFQYIFSGGSKENLAKARARITWAIVGLLLVSIAFLVAQFAVEILQPKQAPPI